MERLRSITMHLCDNIRLAWMFASYSRFSLCEFGRSTRAHIDGGLSQRRRALGAGEGDEIIEIRIAACTSA